MLVGSAAWSVHHVKRDVHFGLCFFVAHIHYCFWGICLQHVLFSDLYSSYSPSAKCSAVYIHLVSHQRNYAFLNPLVLQRGSETTGTERRSHSWSRAQSHSALPVCLLAPFFWQILATSVEGNHPVGTDRLAHLTVRRVCETLHQRTLPDAPWWPESCSDQSSRMTRWSCNNKTHMNLLWKHNALFSGCFF